MSIATDITATIDLDPAANWADAAEGAWLAEASAAGVAAEVVSWDVPDYATDVAIVEVDGVRYVLHCEDRRGYWLVTAVA